MGREGLMVNRWRAREQVMGGLICLGIWTSCSRPALLSLFLKNLLCESAVSVTEMLSEEGECVLVNCTHCSC